MVCLFLTSHPQLTNVITDALAFLVVIGFVRSGPLKGFKMPRLLRTFVQDSTVYFLIIFTSHFVLEMSLLLARVSVPVPVVDDESAVEHSSSQLYNSCRHCRCEGLDACERTSNHLFPCAPAFSGTFVYVATTSGTYHSKTLTKVDLSLGISPRWLAD
jgi:hypothetical protein